MLLHIHTMANPTWSHVWHVEKIGYPTPKQTPKTVATQKSSRHQLQSWSTPQNATSHKEKKRQITKSCSLQKKRLLGFF